MEKIRPRIAPKATVKIYSVDGLTVEQSGGKWLVKDPQGKLVSSHASEQEANKACEKGYAQEQESHDYVNCIKGVEIFSSGLHNGDSYTEQDLDDIVQAYQSLDYTPAIKVGHTKDTPGAPAYGWVKNLKRAGNKLYADFTDMHDSVVDAIRKKSYDRVSSEIYFNLKRGGKEFRRALKAVALLGAEVPAVSGLTPLHKMQFAEEGFDSVATCEQALDVRPQVILDSLAERVYGLTTLIKEFDMAKNTAKIKELSAQVDKFNADMEELKKKKAGMTDEELEGDDEIKKLSENASALGEQIAQLEAEDADYNDDTSSHIAQLSEQLATARAEAAAASKRAEENATQIKLLSERQARADAERNAGVVKQKIEACKIPSFRDNLSTLYMYAMTNTATVKVYSTDKDGKSVSADKSLVDVLDDTVTQINKHSEKLFSQLAQQGKTVREDGETEDAADAEVNKRVHAYMIEHPDVKSYTQAMTHVLAKDVALNERYQQQLANKH